MNADGRNDNDWKQRARALRAYRRYGLFSLALFFAAYCWMFRGNLLLTDVIKYAVYALLSALAMTFVVYVARKFYHHVGWEWPYEDGLK